MAGNFPMSQISGSLSQQVAAERKGERRSLRTGLESMFQPSSIAVIGASERAGGVGYSLLSNLLESRSRQKLYAVNPNHEQILGVPAYKNISQIADPVDLAIVVT